MIEQFTEEELKQIEKELEILKLEKRQGTRSQIIKKAAMELEMGDIFMSTDLKDSFIKILDYLTKNYTTTKTSSGIPRDVRNKIVPEELREEYLNLAKVLLNAMKPYYGMLGFADRNTWNERFREECTRDVLKKVYGKGVTE